MNRVKSIIGVGIFLFSLVGIFSVVNEKIYAKNQDEYTIHVVNRKSGKNTAYDVENTENRDIISDAYVPKRKKISASNDISVQNIVGTDDRQLVTSTFSFPYRTIARITVTHQDNTLTYGSGAMIGKNLFARAGHVLINDSLSHPKSIKIEFGLYGSSAYFTTTNYSSYIYYGDYHGYDTKHDYGFVVLSSNVGSDVTGYMGFSTSWDSSNPIYVAGYPGGNPYMYIGSGNIYNTTDDVYTINVDTTAGQSGGPAYGLVDGMPCFIGVFSGNNGEKNYVRRFDYQLYQWLNSNGYI